MFEAPCRGLPGRAFRLLTVCLLFACGCTPERLVYAPVAPLQQVDHVDGRAERIYDFTGDGAGDYRETLSPDGRVVELAFDPDGSGGWKQIVDRSVPAAAAGEAKPRRQLLIILDSIPFEMVEESYAQGRFRLFYPPARILSPFPVMTDICLNDFFGINPSTGVETEYYDGRQLHDGWSAYSKQANSTWLREVDSFLPYTGHADAYMDPQSWFDIEMARIHRDFLNRLDGDVTAYVVATSALGIRFSRDGHASGLVRLDRFCRMLMHATRGQIDITLMSDHGHNLIVSRRINLDQDLAQMGYRLTNKLTGPADVIVPAFGLVNCTALYTQSPEQVAADLIGLEGIELTCYPTPSGDVVVLSPSGRAVVSYRDGASRYLQVVGDPLKLEPIMRELAAGGHVNGDGFVDDAKLFEALVEHEYPDVLYRLHRAFNGLIQHPPNVVASLADGYCWGSPFMARFLNVAATHGNLTRRSSTGFVMSTATRMPYAVRMGNLRGELSRRGIRTPHSEPGP